MRGPDDQPGCARLTSFLPLTPPRSNNIRTFVRDVGPEKVLSFLCSASYSRVSRTFSSRKFSFTGSGKCRKSVALRGLRHAVR